MIFFFNSLDFFKFCRFATNTMFFVNILFQALSIHQKRKFPQDIPSNRVHFWV